VSFQKTIYKEKIMNLKKFSLEKVSRKVATCVRKSLYPKILKWQKVSRQDKKNGRNANLSKCTKALEDSCCSTIENLLFYLINSQKSLASDFLFVWSHYTTIL
jgi:hypothetical protein